MQIETTRFGQIEVAEEAILQFPRGLYGLEKARSYCLLRHDEAGCFHWLQSAVEPALAMLVTDPFQFFSGYEVEIADAAAELLQVTSPTEVTTYVTVTLAENGQQIHANLLGPLVINHQAGLGAQLIQDAGRYTTRHPIGERATEGQEEGIAPGGMTDDRDPRSTSGGEPASAGCGRSGSFRPLVVPV